jgi:hypothetical protein
LPGVPAFGFAGVSPRLIGAQGRECGIVGAAGEVDFDAAHFVVQAPGESNCGNCVTATVVTAVAEGGFDGGIAVMFVGPELERVAAPRGGKLDLPTDCVRATDYVHSVGDDAGAACVRTICPFEGVGIEAYEEFLIYDDLRFTKAPIACACPCV